MDNPVTEQELVTRSPGRRVTLDDLKANIKDIFYFTAANGVADVYGIPVESDDMPDSLRLLTFCVIVLNNGFTVIGQSACADPVNYKMDVGQRLALADAERQIWPLMGYALKEELAREQALLATRAFPTPLDMTYVGTKVVVAMPMSRAEYNLLRGWEVPADENGNDQGYFVEYTDRLETPPHVKGFKGYVSWSPKEVFERAYRPVRQGAPATASAQTAG